jgi:hypothetical protein
MINDIFATSMHGRYSTNQSGRLIEEGEWTYRGFGNAEIAMTASATRPVDGSAYELRLHSVERQLDGIAFRSTGGDLPTRAFEAKITGHIVTVSAPGDEGKEETGNFSVPPETIYDGPSPIWLIHLVMTAPPPTDRMPTTPVVRFGLATGELVGGFYRIERAGNDVTATVLDKDGSQIDTLSILLAEDGCPTRIVRGDLETEIVRLPSA